MLVVAADTFFIGILVWAAASDLATLTIPNRIILALLAGYAVLALLSDVALMQGLLAGVLALAGTLVLFSCGWIGGGDAKLFAAAALWLGFEQLVPLLVATSLAGAVLTIGMVLLRARPVPAFWARRPWIARLLNPQSGVPYGIAIAVAGCAVLATAG
jgi:prepilin peptidase CpaA